MATVSWSVDGGGDDGVERASLAPPPEELGRPLADSFVLARTAVTAVLVQAIRVYSTGCIVNVRWIRRRQHESGSDWTALQEDAHGFLMDYLTDADGLKIRFEPDPWTPSSEGAVGASLHSDSTRITGDLVLWLTPLPVAADARLTCSWDRYSVAHTSHSIDMAALSAAASHPMTAWS